MLDVRWVCLGSDRHSLISPSDILVLDSSFCVLFEPCWYLLKAHVGRLSATYRGALILVSDILSLCLCVVSLCLETGYPGLCERVVCGGIMSDQTSDQNRRIRPQIRPVRSDLSGQTQMYIYIPNRIYIYIYIYTICIPNRCTYMYGE
jgi:hypothetical protein